MADNIILAVTFYFFFAFILSVKNLHLIIYKMFSPKGDSQMINRIKPTEKQVKKHLNSQLD